MFRFVYIVLMLALVLIAGCSHPRALVNDCYDAGPNLENCAIIKRL
jgi:hypothetical protein